MHLHRYSLVAALAVVAASSSSAQEGHEAHGMQDSASKGPTVSAGASAILLGTFANPGVNNRNLAEGYLTQPMVMAMLASRGQRFVAAITLNFEGSTLERGELNAGVHGEGYVDRRHPHTMLHELVATGIVPAGPARFSVTAGKGFVPFGTDDPMSRPFVKYPVNHHLAQILERAMISGAADFGTLVFEGSAFNGDEPESPRDLPNHDRVGDSWSARVTGRVKHLELQGSYARVESPEETTGEGLDHRKSSISARYESRGRYLLAEWARTHEGEDDVTAFTFRSLLAEGSLQFGRITVALRGERSERPEEERGLNPFRTPRPHSDLGIIGRTRWDIVTGHLAARLPDYRKIQIVPFLEIATQKPESLTTPTVFEPAEFYGESRLWSFSFGMRVGAGMKHPRMGRYGAAVERDTHSHAEVK